MGGAPTHTVNIGSECRFPGRENCTVTYNSWYSKEDLAWFCDLISDACDKKPFNLTYGV